MPVYVITADECDYDQYGAFVAIAKDSDTALAMMSEYFTAHQRKGKVTVEEIDPNGESRVILTSFNAG